jgi:hypothetical protein
LRHSFSFCRLNTDVINPLLKEAYNVNTKLNNGGIHTWYTVALKIFDECEMDLGEYENLDRPYNLCSFGIFLYRPISIFKL